MTTRNKILLSVGAVCLVAVIAVVAVVAVFAARTQTVNSSITIKYTATQVKGTAKANYYLGKTTDPTKMTTDGQTPGDSNVELKFEVGVDNGGEKTLKPSGDIDLSTAEEGSLYVVFEYIFTNTGLQDYTAALTVNSLTAENVEVYVYDGEGSETLTDIHGWVKNQETSGSVTYFTPKTVAHSTGEHHFYVVVRVTDETSGSDASYEGTFVWTLIGQETAD